MAKNEDFQILDSVATPVFVLAVQPSGLIVYEAWNKEAVEQSGLPREAMIGKTAAEIYPGRQGSIPYEQHQKTARSGVCRTYEITLSLKGSLRYIRTTLTPVFSTDGRVTRLTGTSIDLTSEREHQLAVVQSEADASVLAGEMEQFLSMAAHDLRTPMRHVKLIAQMLREDFTDLGDGKLELIDRLETVGVKATDLISEVLAYARATTISERRRPFDFGELCSDIFSVLDPQEEHSLSGTSVRLEADDVALQIILRNLVDNAIKHAGRSPVEVKISVAVSELGKLDFEVLDNGVGFDNPAIAFLDSGNFRRESGFGLLGISRLVNSRGCKIAAETRLPGTGSCVRFNYPGKLIA